MKVAPAPAYVIIASFTADCDITLPSFPVKGIKQKRSAGRAVCKMYCDNVAISFSNFHFSANIVLYSIKSSTAA